MFLILYDGEIDSIFFDKLDAEQYLQLFPQDQWDRFDFVELDEHRASVIASIAVDIYDNYKFCKVTGLVD